MKVRVLHLITRLDLGGAQQNTLFCVESHDRERFEVALLAGSGGELDDQARAIRDARVDLVPWLRHPIAPPPPTVRARVWGTLSLLAAIASAGLIGSSGSRYRASPGGRSTSNPSCPTAPLAVRYDQPPSIFLQPVWVKIRRY